MNIIFPIIELIDRLAIAEIKFEKTKLNLEEYQWYQGQFNNLQMQGIQTEYQALKQIHLQIWSLESDLKSGLEHRHSLEEIGRRAIEIRNWNNKRIELKNTIAGKLKCSVREVKSDHLSE
jgi:hypothetical protein